MKQNKNNNRAYTDLVHRHNDLIGKMNTLSFEMRGKKPELDQMKSEQMFLKDKLKIKLSKQK